MTKGILVNITNENYHALPLRSRVLTSVPQFQVLCTGLICGRSVCDALVNLGRFVTVSNFLRACEAGGSHTCGWTRDSHNLRINCNRFKVSEVVVIMLVGASSYISYAEMLLCRFGSGNQNARFYGGRLSSAGARSFTRARVIALVMHGCLSL